MYRIIAPHAGGLGDVLMYSTLPALFKSRGDTVFWATSPEFRNPEVEKLILLDPNIAGLIGRATPNAGGAIFKGSDIISEAKRCVTSIDAVEQLHGFKIGAGFLALPRISYEPKFLPEWDNKVVADCRSISQPISPLVWNEFEAWVYRWHFDGGEPRPTMLDSKFSGGNGTETAANNPHHFCRCLFETIDIIYSCKAFLTVESGMNMLASAIKHCWRTSLPVFCCMTTMSYNDKLFTMPNVTYYITGRMTPDYHVYP